MVTELLFHVRWATEEEEEEEEKGRKGRNKEVSSPFLFGPFPPLCFGGGGGEEIGELRKEQKETHFQPFSLLSLSLSVWRI